MSSVVSWYKRFWAKEPVCYPERIGFCVGDRVVIRGLHRYATEDPESTALEGAVGTVSSRELGIWDVGFYIILLDVPMPDAKDTAALVSTDCLYKEGA